MLQPQVFSLAGEECRCLLCCCWRIYSWLRQSDGQCAGGPSRLCLAPPRHFGADVFTVSPSSVVGREQGHTRCICDPCASEGSFGTLKLAALPAVGVVLPAVLSPILQSCQVPAEAPARGCGNRATHGPGETALELCESWACPAHFQARGSLCPPWNIVPPGP